MSISKDMRICFVGDSFVNGFGDEDLLGWSGRLVKMSRSDDLEITYYNLGIRRNTTADVKERWESECRARLPEGSDNIVVFSFGVNDTVIEKNELRVAKEQSLENVGTILTGASKKYKVRMIGPPPIEDPNQNLRIKELDQAFQFLCDKLEIPYLSIFDHLLGQPIWLKEVSSNDGAHPHSGGYSLLAGFVNTWDQWKF